MSDPLLHVGQVVAGRYVVEGILGVGGLAEVYRVKHTGLGSLHALKVLTIRRRGFDERLRLEGQIQAQLRHPNVVSVTDIVEVDGQPGLLMEYVDGTTLEALLRERGKLSHEETLALMTPVLGALVTAHGIGAVHRDLKPANILLARTPLGWVPKVVDFGIGKLVDSPTTEGNPRASDTRAGVAMGTPGYISPEQVRDSSTVDQRTDVFALGVMLYQMIAGRLPYANPDGSTDITTTLVRDAPPLATLAPAVPAHVAEAIHVAIRKEPEDRFGTLTAFVAALGLSGNPMLVETGGASRTSWSSPPQSAATTGGATLDGAVRPAVRPTPTGMGARLVLIGLPLALGLVVVGALAVGLSFYLAMWVDGPQVVVPAPPPVVEAPLPASPDPVAPAPIEPTTAANTDLVPPTPAPPAPLGQPAPLGVQPAPLPVEPVPTVVPEPSEDVAAVELPAPDPEPVVPEPVAPLPAVVTPEPEPVARIEASGRWVGKAQGRPLTLSLTTAGTSAQGEMLFFPNRTVRVSGTIDPTTGELRLRSDDGIRVDGRVVGARLDGSYASGDMKSIPFALSK